MKQVILTTTGNDSGTYTVTELPDEKSWWSCISHKDIFPVRFRHPLLFCIFITILSISCSPVISVNHKIADPGITSYMIECDSVAYDDTAYFEHTFFKFTDKGYLLHNFQQKDFAFKILENKVYTAKEDSTIKVNMFRVFSYFNGKEYSVFSTFKEGSSIQFNHPDRVIRFRILSVGNIPEATDHLWWR